MLFRSLELLKVELVISETLSAGTVDLQEKRQELQAKLNMVWKNKADPEKGKDCFKLQTMTKQFATTIVDPLTLLVSTDF